MTHTVYVEEGSTDVFDEAMLEEQYQAIIDETTDSIVIMGMTYYPSTVLMCTDPTAYRCGFSDFLSDYNEYEIPDEVEWEDIPEYLGLV